MAKAIYSTGWDGSMVFEVDTKGNWKLMPSAEIPFIAASDELAPESIVDINRASEEQLQQLPMIGPARAATIVANRAQFGPFRSVEDLGRVKGIGRATINVLRNYATALPLGM